jgi:hypothetical protein
MHCYGKFAFEKNNYGYDLCGEYSDWAITLSFSIPYLLNVQKKDSTYLNWVWWFY